MWIPIRPDPLEGDVLEFHTSDDEKKPTGKIMFCEIDYESLLEVMEESTRE